jgi:hypothetical protein
MSRLNSSREIWHPQTRLDREAVLKQLHEVLASAQFCNSKRYPALLQYIVEKTLNGEADVLKERTLGVEVFDRPPSYDTNADTVVRYTAGEVRKRLSLYYHELNEKPEIQISLPAGSYVPEFVHTRDEVERKLTSEHSSVAVVAQDRVHEPTRFQLADSFSPPLRLSTQPASSFNRRTGLILFLSGLLIAAGWSWKKHTAQAASQVSSFWAPILHDQSAVMVCTGGSVFAQNNFSGVVTAGKDNDYPFISMQTASAIAQLSGLLQLNGATPQLQSAASTPLTELREHPVIMLGGYNNQWTVRLLQPLPFHFSPEDPNPSIIDATQSGIHWQRDHSLSYSSADDYAVVARFHNNMTDSWVVALAGLGRNGTEAAAQFVTSPHYLQLLRDRLGKDFDKSNIEVVLKVNVIDGKTGAPTIVALHTW